MDERETILDRIEGEFGPVGKGIVSILYDTENLLTLEDIAQKLKERDHDLDPKEIRQILYQLQDKGYARSRRYRDDDTGWISFLWNLFPDKILR